MQWQAKSREYDLSEYQLIDKALKGDKDALSLLLQNNYQFIMGYFLKLTSSQELSLDLTQETMLRAIKKLNQFNKKAKLSTWLITIGTNIYRDWLRKEKRAKEELEQLVFNEPLPKNDALNQIIDCLPPEKRLPLVLKYYYGYTYEEIAIILEIPPGTVRSRLHNTIKELRCKL